MQTSAPCPSSSGQVDPFSLGTLPGSGRCSDPCAWGIFTASFLREGAQRVFAVWASHGLKLRERRSSSSSSGDNQDFKGNLKNTSMVTLPDRGLCRGVWWGWAGCSLCTLLPALQPGGRRWLPAPEALGCRLVSGASPQGPAHHAANSSAGCSQLRYDTRGGGAGCQVIAGPQPARRSGCHHADRPLSLWTGCHCLGRGVSLCGTAWAKRT